MNLVRIIPRLDVKVPNVTKGAHVEGLRTVGNPAILAREYYEQGADEILYVNIMGSLSERNNLLEVVAQTTSLGVFIPIIVGGGVRTIEHVQQALRAGADKVAISTAAIKEPGFVAKAAQLFGPQCIVGSIEVKKAGDQKWEVCMDNGRQMTGLDAIEWAKTLVELGAGELLVTSVDAEGEQKGYDTDALKSIIQNVPVPVIVSGGAGSIEDIANCIKEVRCDGVSMASLLHYNKSTIGEIKNYLTQQGIPVRIPPPLTLYQMHPGSNRKKVSVVDYGLTNIKSITSAFEHVGSEVQVISAPEDCLQADLLVLPGGGTFADGMNALKQRNLVPAIDNHVKRGKPLLGICLGMHLLMGESGDPGRVKGLGAIPGRVVYVLNQKPLTELNAHALQLGWNSINVPGPGAWDHTILKDVPQKCPFYFDHLHYVVPERPEHVLAEMGSERQRFCSVVQSGKVYGTQFRPEKSGELGLRILDAFGRL